MNRTVLSYFLCIIVILSASSGLTNPQAESATARPSQYVMVGFDGGLRVEQWQKIRAFTDAMNRLKKPLNLTYFVSGVYLLSDNNRRLYAPPKHSAGSSMIGFAEDNVQIISDRVDQMNGAFIEGQEIASHANGHFNAADEKWGLNDWSAELKQYIDLLLGAFFNNQAQPNPNNTYPQGYAFDAKEIVGFRAPYLGVTPSLFPALKTYGYTYDASTTGEATDWPRKDAHGLWRFSIPTITIAGTGKKILSMDYNFYVAQSKAQEDLPNREAHRRQMVDSYLNYFNANYYGNRAPVYIGHHFALYNGGAYWDALQDFTKEVCGMPEVKCIDYKQYAMWISSLSEETLNAYRAGNFERMPRPQQLTHESARSLDVSLQILKKGEKLEIEASGTDYREALMKLVVRINGKVIAPKNLTLPFMRQHFLLGADLEISATLLNRKGSEIQRATHVIRDLGTPQEQFMRSPLEARLLLGDLPEAHEWESSSELSH